MFICIVNVRGLASLILSAMKDSEASRIFLLHFTFLRIRNLFIYRSNSVSSEVIYRTMSVKQFRGNQWGFP